jgi:cytochrome c oxidase subunit I+III
LWDQKQTDEGDARLEKLTRALARWPLTWRAALTTSMEGRPEEVFRLSGPSIWPFIAAIGTVIIFASEIFRVHMMTLVGGVIVAVSLVAWHWPSAAPTTAEEEEAFEKEHGVPVRTKGSRAVARWGMALTIMNLAIALASFLFSYFYIRIENTAWPPENMPLPNLSLPIAATLVLLLSAGVMAWALRSIQMGNQGRLRAGLAGAFVLGALALGLLIFDYTQLGFDAQINAYGSLFFMLGAFVFLVVLAGLGMNAIVQFWAWRGHYTMGRHVAVSNTTLYWYAMIIFWIITLATLYVSPHVL